MPPGRSRLGAKWQLDAALLSNPVDLTPLVSLSQTNPRDFLAEDTLGRMVKMLLNSTNETRSDKETRLDVLTILANLAENDECRESARMALQGVDQWFDEYMGREREEEHPELHKLMLLLLSRLYEYTLKTEDLLDLVQGDKVLGLETVVGLLEDGEVYTTELRQKQAPKLGQVGQWEHTLVSHRHEKPLVLQLSRLLRGFTMPCSYFQREDRELTEHAVGEFTDEINVLLDITIKSRLLEKLALACHDCLFNLADDDDGRCSLGEDDHRSICCIHSFLQNLYFYATSSRADEYRRHLLGDTMLVPRLILPYLDRAIDCALETKEKECRMLIQGISASLRTLIIASFRIPSSRSIVDLLRRFNPTQTILRASTLIARHDYIFALLCLVNVNMDSLSVDADDERLEAEDEETATTTLRARQRTRLGHTLLHALASVYRQLDEEAQARVVQTVKSSGSLPVSRDTPSFSAMMSVLLGGSSSRQLEYAVGQLCDEKSDDEQRELAEVSQREARAEAKQEAKERLCNARRKFLHRQNEEAVTSESFRLLGELPSLDENRRQSLDVASLRIEALSNGDGRGQRSALRLRVPEKTKKTRKSEEEFPREFACAINGHMMKEPMRSPHGEVFEKSTIELWLSTRGSVCPITGHALTMEDLEEDKNLRSRLIQWHVERMKTTMETSMSAMHGEEDDLYDF